jgi:hypothetical protein
MIRPLTRKPTSMIEPIRAVHAEIHLVPAAERLKE